MSDFHQHGLISTLHWLGERPAVELAAEAAVLASRRRLALVLPCHGRDLDRAPFDLILEELARLPFPGELILALNGVEAPAVEGAMDRLGRLPFPARVVWVDGPRLRPVLMELEKAGSGPLPRGKGLNVWFGVGCALAGGAEVVATQDADIANYRGEMAMRLVLPCLHPAIGYRFGKGYYRRVSDRLYGRVTRLFVIPLVAALQRLAGHHPLLDFVECFRYPLAGEMVFAADLAGSLVFPAGWDLELGLLCAIHREIEPREVCQVDIGPEYEHKHQPLLAPPDGAGRGLGEMAGQIAIALLGALACEGATIDAQFLDALRPAYAKATTDTIRCYRDVAWLNGIPFSEREEFAVAAAFADSLPDAPKFLGALPAGGLAPWKRVFAALPGIGESLRGG